ncbi:SPOR domain-containing protein [Phenylobacterium sp.]|uniref:SPOR domain-containing protein n=1 Tax=Phenylobacterium sp. TaxID=1871053 RepID=UPI002DF12EEA|nr:SPOR domain-containing protein [Phenylobacterium sp.]
MGSAHRGPVGARSALTVVAGCVLLAACATSQPEGGGAAALFKAQIGDISGGVAPGPHSVWYVQRQPVAYVKMGFATWQPERHGLRAWWSRHFGRHPTGKGAETTGVASANLGLPVPSRVQVTNVAGGEVITVRIDDKAPMGDGILRLSPEAAKALGADPGKPLLIRMRYLAPVVAYNERPTLRYALRGAPRRLPAAVQPAAPTVLAQARPSPAPTPPPVAAPPEIIRVADSHPAALALRPLHAAPEPKAQPAAPAATMHAFRVQAGAFASLANAHHAVSMLQPAGAAVIEPVSRGAETLYRVIVPGPRDAGSAERLRARVAQIGFSDARLIRPL